MPRLKLLSAIALVVCLGLPVSTCSSYRDANGNSVALAVGESPPQGSQVTTTSNYPITSWSEACWALAWLWPLLVLVYDHLAEPRALRSVIWFFEPLLLFLSGAVVTLRGIPGEAAIGWFLAVSALLGLAIVWIAEAFSKVRHRQRAA